MAATLADSELLVSCGLVRLLVRLDGHVSVEEREAIESIGQVLASRVNGSSSPYSVAEANTTEAIDEFWHTMARADEAFATREQLQQSALGINSPQARETIYEALFDLAASDTIVKQEWTLLTWLRDAWKIPS